MGVYTFTFTVAGIGAARAAQIEQRLEQRLGEDAVTVVSIGHAAQTSTYEVRGVDVADRSVFVERVEAVSDSEAEALAVGGSASRVVAGCSEVTG